MDELQTLFERVHHQSGSSTVDLRYRPDNDEPPWAVVIDWGNKYRAVVPGSAQDDPITSLNAALSYFELQRTNIR